jgi:dihydroxy-acid dehydratase
MACIAEALGMALPGSASIPAGDSRRLLLAQAAGRRAVELAKEDLTPTRILTTQAFENAIRVLVSIAGSTNAVIHLLAIAGRVGLDYPLHTFDAIAQTTPMLANVKPCGDYLMQDFFEAGGVPALLNELKPLLHLDALTVTGRTVGGNASEAAVLNKAVIGSLSEPVSAGPTLVVLKGNLAPDGAILKQAAASPHLLTHVGPALVFEGYTDFRQRLDDPELDVTRDSILVIRGMGPRGSSANGVDCLETQTLPEKLLRAGVRDLVRVSDGRMSGTAFGTVVLHVAPESASGGPLAVVQDGDVIRLDAASRRLDVDISDRELRARLARWHATPMGPSRGYTRLYLDHVEPFHKGADFDFLKGAEQTTTGSTPL